MADEARETWVAAKKQVNYQVSNQMAEKYVQISFVKSSFSIFISLGRVDLVCSQLILRWQSVMMVITRKLKVSYCQFKLV